MRNDPWKRTTQWTVPTKWLLMVALGMPGCAPSGDEQARDTQADSGQVVDARGSDTTSDTAPLAPEGALRAALDTLLVGRGPAGTEVTWFSPATARALRSVRVDSSGHAIVDFEDLRALIPNASSSAGSEMLLSELNATVFSIAAVRSVDYLIEGRCEFFWEWLQRGCQTVHRTG